MKDDNKLYWIWLTNAIGRSYRFYRALSKYYSSVFEIYRAPRESFCAIEGLTDGVIGRLCDKDLLDARKVIDNCVMSGIRILTWDSEKYPSLLRQIEDPPLVLYTRGKLPAFEERLFVAVVGTRKMTEYGKCEAYRFGYGLARNGACVVSGMALGNDSAAMCGALDADGFVIGVLGCGVDIAYPAEHRHLLEITAKRGAIISEYPPGTRPEPRFFPERNRIISGLCRSVLIVECNERSGAMITARCAVSQGRDLFAIPGRNGENSSEGTLSLLREGVPVAADPVDILSEYTFLYGGKIDLRKYGEFSSETIDTRLGVYGVGYSRSKYNPEGAFAKAKDASVPAATREKTPDAPDAPRSSDDASGTAVAKKVEKVVKILTGETRREKKRDTVPVQKTKSVSMADLSEKVNALSPELRQIYLKLPKGKTFDADEVSADGIAVSDLMSSLTMLELEGLIRSLPGGRYTTDTES